MNYYPKRLLFSPLQRFFNRFKEKISKDLFKKIVTFVLEKKAKESDRLRLTLSGEIRSVLYA